MTRQCPNDPSNPNDCKQHPCTAYAAWRRRRRLECICNNTGQVARPTNSTYGSCPDLTGKQCPKGQKNVENQCVTPCSDPTKLQMADGSCCDPKQVSACGTCCPKVRRQIRAPATARRSRSSRSANERGAHQSGPWPQAARRMEVWLTLLSSWWRGPIRLSAQEDPSRNPCCRQCRGQRLFRHYPASANPARRRSRGQNLHRSLPTVAAYRRSAHMGGPPTAQFVAARKPATGSAAQIGQVFARRHRQCQSARHLCGVDLGLWLTDRCARAGRPAARCATGAPNASLHARPLGGAAGGADRIDLEDRRRDRRRQSVRRREARRPS